MVVEVVPVAVRVALPLAVVVVVEGIVTVKVEDILIGVVGVKAAVVLAVP